MTIGSAFQAYKNPLLIDLTPTELYEEIYKEKDKAEAIYSFIKTVANLGSKHGMLTLEIDGKEVQLVLHIKDLK